MRPRPQDIYFIQAGTDGPIKIGITSNLRSRLASLQHANAAPLRVLGVMPGAGWVAEVGLHDRFGRTRLHGEWFEPTPGLLAYIAEHAEPNGEPAGKAAAS